MQNNKISKFIFIIFIFTIPIVAFAADPKWNMPDPKIKIPGIENFKDNPKMEPNCVDIAGGKQECSIPWLSEYIAGIYKYAIGIVAILATIVMMIAGVLWITAAGDSGRIGEAKQWMTGAITGMVLAFASYSILYFVNPDLVRLKPITVEIVKKVEPAMPSSERYVNCGWETVLNCPNGKSLSDDNYCKSSGTKYNNATLCCCTIKPLLGCTWKNAGCGGGENLTEAINKSDCGTKTNESDFTCCCPKSLDTTSAISYLLNNATFSNNGDCTGFNAQKSIQEIAKDGTATACSPDCTCTKKVEVNPKIIIALSELSSVQKLTITSITTGKHLANSDHYLGQAVDVSTPNKGDWQLIVNSLKVNGFNAFCDKDGIKVSCSDATHIHFNAK